MGFAETCEVAVVEAVDDLIKFPFAFAFVGRWLWLLDLRPSPKSFVSTEKALMLSSLMLIAF